MQDNVYSEINFSENLKTILAVLGCTNSDLAVYGECSASNISRIRSGARVCKMNSNTMYSIVNGIYGYTEAHRYLEKLYKLMGLKSDLSPDKTKNAIVHWMYSENDNKLHKSVGNSRTGRKLPFNFYSEKLNAIMDMLDLSNVKLGKAIHVDPSYISRLRNGTRVPKRNSDITDRISEYLLERIIEQDKLRPLARMINVTMRSFEDADYRKNVFLKWINDKDNIAEESAVEKLLENIDSFKPAIYSTLPNISSIVSKEVLTDLKYEYIGVKGLQTAVIRFLSNSVYEKADELWLYSDEDMSWIADDKEFLLKWTVLLGTCVKNRIKIKIIHTVDRDPDEMIKGLESWIPLYMSGMIEPYMSRRKVDNRFSHSMFICPNKSCIEACHVKGSESFGLYRYHTEQEHIDIYMKQYEMLLSTCDPLMKIYTQADLAKYISFTDNVVNEGGITSVLQSLSLGFMDKSLLDKMLSKADCNDEELEKIYTFWQSRVSMYERALQDEKIREMIPLPSKESIDKGEVILNLGTIRHELLIPYEKEDYARYIRNIINIIDRYKNYNLIPLPELPFINVQIIINGDNISIIKTDFPKISFVISNQYIVSAFKDYTARLAGKYAKDRETVKKMLSEYLD